jgi:hypothetical protein
MHCFVNFHSIRSVSLNAIVLGKSPISVCNLFLSFCPMTLEGGHLWPGQAWMSYYVNLNLPFFPSIPLTLLFFELELTLCYKIYRFEIWDIQSRMVELKKEILRILSFVIYAGGLSKVRRTRHYSVPQSLPNYKSLYLHLMMEKISLKCL